MTTLTNLISVHHLYIPHYQKVLDGNDVVSIEWYSKELGAIETDLTMINQR